MQRFKTILVRITIPFIVLICTWHSLNVSWYKHWNKIIASDGKGYYSYLPAVFIYHDLNFHFFDSIEPKYYDEHLTYDYRVNINGKIIDKYFCGVSILQLPFFFGAHLAAYIGGYDMDGYSKPYAVGMNIGAIFWLMIGLIFLRRLLISFGANRVQGSLLLLTFVFGTNLFYYTVCNGLFTHVYSFTLFCIFLVYSKKWVETKRNKYLLFTFLALGFIAVIRPVNLLIVLWIPFAAGSIPATVPLIKDLFSKPLFLFCSICLFIFPLLSQLIIYKISTGQFYVYSYGLERFYFTRPELINFLFSYRKGLFVWTPLTFLSLFGLIPLWKQNRFRAIWMFITIFVVVYILSCWWSWFYGGSFGMRPMIEFYPLFAILFYYLIDSVKGKALKTILFTLTFLLILFCQFQTFQYRYQVIHWSLMDKEKYWDVFLNFHFMK